MKTRILLLITLASFGATILAGCGKKDDEGDTKPLPPVKSGDPVGKSQAQSQAL
jgi:hypothetical protein